jgi:electron transfer flavoprotein beta subunit
MLAALLGIGQGIAISALEVHDNEVRVTREVDGGTETLALRLPAVVTADLRLNEPRYVKLPNLMMAKKKPIQAVNAAELGVAASPRLKQLTVADPPARKAGIKVGSVHELVEKLRVDARVL